MKSALKYGSMMALAFLLLFWPAQSQTTSATVYYTATSVDANGLESGNSVQIPAVISTAHHTITFTITPPISGSTPVSYNVYQSLSATTGPYTKIGSTATTSLVYTVPLPNPPGLADAVN